MVNSRAGGLTGDLGGARVGGMNDFDQLLSEYKAAVDGWVEAIHAEEALASADHSMVTMEKWDAAALAVADAEHRSARAMYAYKDALRKVNYGF